MTTNAAPTAAALRELAVATDTAAAALDETFARLTMRHAAAVSTIRHINGERPGRYGRRGVREYELDVAGSVALARQRLAAGEVEPWNVGNVEDALRKLDELREQIRANRADADKLEAVWEAHGWSRYFTVKGGHIHRDHTWGRCNRQVTTQHGWNPELSGLSEAEAVAALGPSLCTVCFPSAPVEWTVGHAKPARCAGSGKYVREERRVGMRSYASCPECGEWSLRTSTGVIRAHKPAAE